MAKELECVGNLNCDVASDHALAAEPGMKSESIGHIQPILFVFIHFREILFALFYDHVTSCARTVAAARVFEVKAAIQSDIQQRTFFSVLMIWRHSRFVLDRQRLAVRAKESDFIDLPFSSSLLSFGDCAGTCFSDFHAHPSATSDASRSLSAAT